MIPANGPATRSGAQQVICTVPDPEMPYVTLGDLGVVGAVTEDGASGSVHVWLTPTYLGCPATEAIRQDVEAALLAAGWHAVTVELRFDPPWTPDRITAEGRAKLAAEGIAPPAAGRRNASGPVTLEFGHPRLGSTDVMSVHCPQCGAPDTRLLSAFGATPCQELRRCGSCGEPFPAIKATR